MTIDGDRRGRRTCCVDVETARRRASVVALGLFLGIAVVGVPASACGSGQALEGPGPGSPYATSTVQTSVPSATQSTSPHESSGRTAAEVSSSTGSFGPSPPASTVQEIFRAIAEWTAPAPAYGLTELPPGALVSPVWWPMLSVASPGEWQADFFGNPRVMSGTAGPREVQLVLAMGDGWLVILENFRGDLGDVTGSPVGSVAGHEATLYLLNGGVLVQWSDQGAWYGVFGRGLPPDEVARVALGMRPVDGGD